MNAIMDYVCDLATSRGRRADPTKGLEFQRVLGNLLKAAPKAHSEMKARAN